MRTAWIHVRSTIFAICALAALPASAAAHGGPNSAPAGGGETAQVIIGTLATLTVTAVALFLVIGHRRGQVDVLRRGAALAERSTGLPGWAALPLVVLSTSLITAVFGMYWDIATHIDAGRDPGPFANASHYFILVGLFGVFFAGLLAIFLPESGAGRAAVKVPVGGWEAPIGGVVIFLCAGIALSGFPLDDVWHRLFGQDVTLWGPTHLLLFGGASLSVVGALILWVEGNRERGTVRRELPGGAPGVLRKVLQAGFAGALLIGLSTFQGEFDYQVPQFRLILHPVLLMFAAGIALTAARTYLGRGGALMAVAGFIVIRGVLAVLVSPVFEHTTLHFPLYIVEAVVVEAVALRVDPRQRTVAFGAIAGAAIGTFGLAAEWAWSYIWWTIPWPAALLPEAAIAGFVVAVGAGVIGAFIGRALTPEPGRPAASGLALPLAAVAILAVLVYSVPSTAGDPVRANVSLTDAVSGSERAVNATVRLDPPDAADDAHWFNATAWQGEEGRSVVSELKEVSPGVWRTEKPIPVHGAWKSTLRLHKDRAIQGLPIFFPEDPVIPAKATPAEPVFTREFVEDVKNLQREQKPGVSSALTTFGYLTVLAIAFGMLAAMVLSLRRLEQRLSTAPAEAPAAPAGSSG